MWAMSSPVPWRRMGMMLSSRFQCSPRSMSSRRLVSTTPGQMALTRMDRRFAGRVGGGSWSGDLSAHTRDVDDAAGCLRGEPVAGRSPAQQERAVEIHVENVLPGIEVEIDDRLAILAASCAGVVDDDVETAELLDCECDQIVDGTRIGDVADDRERTTAERLDLFGHRGDVAPSGFVLAGRIVLG